MKLKSQPQNIIELIGLWGNVIPEPLLHTHIGFIFARAIIAATDTGIFDAIAGNSKTADEIAEVCNLNKKAVKTILGTLSGVGYLKYSGDLYDLTPISRKWLVKNSPHSIRDFVIFMKILWEWFCNLESFLKTGEGIDYHDKFNSEEWEIYQKAMYCVAKIGADEIGKKTPVPKEAKEMIDIGGSHGLFSVSVCRNHPGLHSTILDLPEAIEKAKPLLEGQNVENLVKYQAGNILTDDLEQEKYDLVFISNLVHHFSENQNKEVCKKAFKALRPKGLLVIQEFIRPNTPDMADQIGNCLDLFFAFTSSSGTWSIAEISSWQKEAGFKIKKPLTFLTLPGVAQVIAEKSG